MDKNTHHTEGVGERGVVREGPRAPGRETDTDTASPRDPHPPTQRWGAGTDTETELGEGRAIELSWKS